MQTKIIESRKVDQSVWSKFVESCPWSTFYETVDWYMTWKCYLESIGTKCEFYGLEILFSDGTKVFVPVFERKVARGLTTLIECSPGALYGGPLSNATLTLHHCESLVKFIKQKYPNLDYCLSPFISVGGHSQDEADDHTQVVDLTSNFLTVFKKNKVDYDFRIAKKNGLELINGNADMVEHFYRSYMIARSRWENNEAPYPQSFFENLKKSDNCDLWLVSHHNEFIGGGVILKCNEHVSSWLAVMHTDQLKFRPYEFYYSSVIEHYQKNGFKWFDFNPSRSLQGVMRFKEKFGSAYIPLKKVKQRSVLLRSLDSISRIL